MTKTKAETIFSDIAELFSEDNLLNPESENVPEDDTSSETEPESIFADYNPKLPVNSVKPVKNSYEDLQTTMNVMRSEVQARNRTSVKQLETKQNTVYGKNVDLRPMPNTLPTAVEAVIRAECEKIRIRTEQWLEDNKEPEDPNRGLSPARLRQQAKAKDEERARSLREAQDKTAKSREIEANTEMV